MVIAPIILRFECAVEVVDDNLPFAQDVFDKKTLNSLTGRFDAKYFSTVGRKINPAARAFS